jgi:hypothetical protein
VNPRRPSSRHVAESDRNGLLNITKEAAVSIKLAGKLPKNHANGVVDLETLLEDNPLVRIPVVGVLVVTRRIAKFDDKEDAVQIEVRFAAIEPVEAGTPDAERTMKTLRTAHQKRTGMAELPGLEPDDEPPE